MVPLWLKDFQTQPTSWGSRFAPFVSGLHRDTREIVLHTEVRREIEIQIDLKFIASATEPEEAQERKRA